MSEQDGLSPEFKEHPLIEFKSVSKVYGRDQARVSALVDVDLKIMKGEFAAIMGPSGSGKSTAMNILGCLDTPTHGYYLFRGVSVGKLSRNQRALLRRLYLGFVFQGFNLLSRTSAIENVELPLIYRGLKSGKRQETAAQALAKVDWPIAANTVRPNSPADNSRGWQSLEHWLPNHPFCWPMNRPLTSIQAAAGRSWSC